MEQYYSWGGAPNPDFYHKVYVKELTSEMLEWCKDYKSNREYYSNPGRFYVNVKGRDREVEIVEFQFELEEPAVMFALKYL